MTTILALDLGTKTGYALAKNGKRIISGMRDGASDRFSGGGMRYLKFRKWLSEMNENQHVDIVFYEEVRAHMAPKAKGKKGGGSMLVDAAHAYGGFLAILTAWCEENKIPYEGLPVGSIKKRATGKGNASKELVKKAMLGHWGLASVEDDNESDALAILLLGLDLMPADTPIPRRRLPSMEFRSW